MILAFAGRRAQALAGVTRSVRRRTEQLLGDLRPRVIVGGAADGADLIVAEAALGMRDGPEVHLVFPTRQETFRADSVAPEWRDRFDAVLAGVVRRGGTLTTLDLPAGQDAYRRGNQTILDMSLGLRVEGERCVVVVVGSPGEGRMIEDLIGRARVSGLPVLRLDPAVELADRETHARSRGTIGRRPAADETAGIESDGGELR